MNSNISSTSNSNEKSRNDSAQLSFLSTNSDNWKPSLMSTVGSSSSNFSTIQPGTKVLNSWCHQKSKLSRCVHRWTIENFSYYQHAEFLRGKLFVPFEDDDDLYDEDKQDLVVDNNGELATVDKEKHRYMWSLKLHPGLPNRDDNKKYIAVYLEYHSPEELDEDDDEEDEEEDEDAEEVEPKTSLEVKAVFNISILGIDGKWHRTMKFRNPVTFNAHSQLDWGTRSLISLDQLMDPVNGLLPNDTLTIGIEVTALSNFIIESGRDVCLSNQIALKPSMNNDFSELWESKCFTDMVIVVHAPTLINVECNDDSNRKEFKVHKAILSIRFPYFGRMLLKQENLNTLDVVNMDHDVFEAVLRFVYCGKVDSIGLLDMRLLPVAHKYKLDPLKRMCEVSLLTKLSHESVTNLLMMADANKAEKLKLKCVRYIRKFPTQVLPTIGWQRMFNEKPGLVREIFNVGVANHQIV